MKKVLLIFIVIIMIIGLIFLGEPKVNAAVIQSIDFEGSYSTSDLAAMYNSGNISIENTEGISNSRCLKFKNDEIETTQARVTFKNLDNHTRYYVTAYIKTVNVENATGTTDTSTGACIWANTIGVYGMTVSKRILGTTEYQQIKLSVFPTDGEINILGELRDAKGEVYIDNIEISSVNAINLKSDGGDILLKVDQDIINEIGQEPLQNWVNNLQIAYDDLYELTTVRPETREENGPIIIECTLTEEEKKSGAAAYSQEGGIIYTYKESMLDTLKEINERGDKEWIFGILHELGHQFDFREAWKFEGEAGTDFKLAYIAEKENLRTAPPEISDELYYQIYDNGGTIIDVMEELSKIYGFLGEPSKYSGSTYKNCSPFGNAYKFLLVKNEIGWDSIKKAYASIHATYGKEFEGTNLEKFDIWINELTKQSGKDVQSLFNTTEWNALLEYCGAFTGNQVKTVTVSQNNLTINRQNANSNINLTATMNPNVGELDWTSSDTNIVKVTDGKLTIVNDGTATITAKSRESGAESTCTVLVDRVNPNITINYSLMSITNQNVFVTIQADENIKINNGNWKKLNDKEYEKEYFENITESIEVTDNAGNISTATIKIENIDKTAPELEVSYSTTKLTNDDVEVTISANEQIQAVEGFELSENNTILKAIFAENTSKTIQVKDIAGNTKEVNIVINNIDKIAPKCIVRYSNTDITNQNITVKIISDKEINEVQGWNLSEDKKILTKIYQENAKENIEIIDDYGNSIKVEVEINNIDKIPPIIEMEKDIETLTNKDVTVTINSNEELKKEDGWKIIEEKISKTYSENISEEVEFEDIAGNKVIVQIEITNIDKTPAEIEVEYNLDGDKVIVTLRSNEEIQKIDGWTLDTTQKIAQKEYMSNQSQTVEVLDLAGNITNASININQIEESSDTQNLQNTDNTVAQGLLPQSGVKNFMIGVIIVLVISSIILFIKHKNILK